MLFYISIEQPKIILNNSDYVEELDAEKDYHARLRKAVGEFYLLIEKQ